MGLKNETSDFPRLGKTLVEPFIFWIKSGNGDVDYSHFTNGTMTATRFDQDGGAGSHVVKLAVQFHFALPLKDVIDFGQLAVVMCFGCYTNIHHMQGSCLIRVVCERASRFPAGAVNGFYLVRVYNLESFVGHLGVHVVFF